jgi:thiamine-phosphate pyrophosphorylase|tara:strand:- start:743 stop:1345 length:603 start_codon:yes stop_codon:yes gene_type:complete
LKRFIYLISPKKIYKNFYHDLNKVLASKKVEFFQLRIKNKNKKKIFQIAKKIGNITKKYNVKLIINDNPKIAQKVKADGCHLGQLDINIVQAKKILKNKIIGITCHNSKKLAQMALKNKASYVAFGSFYKSKLKPDAKKANLKVLKWAKKNVKKPIVVIGGITDKNYKKLIKTGANYIAISSFIWDNPKIKPELVIKNFV